MAEAARTKAEAAAAPPAKPALLDATPKPLALDAIELHGATRFGRRVVRVALVLDDDRRVSFDLPTRPIVVPPGEVAAEPPDVDLDDWQISLLDEIDKVPVGAEATMEELLDRIGLLSPQGPTGQQRAFISSVMRPHGFKRGRRGFRRVSLLPLPEAKD